MLFDYQHVVPLVHLTKTYDPLLIAVSIVIAIISVFTAFGTAERAFHSSTKRYKFYWILFGAVSLGLGIWAMHFIGMLALTLPVPIEYHIGITVGSIFPGIAASAVMLWAMIHRFNSLKQSITAATLFAFGVSAMHFIGMSAMQMQAVMHYELPILLLSILSAIIFATIGIQLQVRAFTVEKKLTLNKHQLASAVVMGMAISSMHYMSMYATHYSAEIHHIEATEFTSSYLAMLVGISVLIIILLSFFIPIILTRQYKNIAETLRQKFESELARNIAITDLAYDAWIHLNSSGHVIGWNKSAETMFGWSKGEALQRELGTLIIPPKYRESHAKGFAQFLLTGNGAVLNKILELEALHKTGRQLLVELTITAISVGEGWEFSAFLRDISERKQEEEKKALLMRELQFEKDALDAHAIVGVLDVNGNILYTNDKFTRISQYSREELLGKNYCSLNFGEEGPLFFENMWTTVSDGKIWNGVIQRKAKGGAAYWVSLTVVPFLDEQGVPVRYVSIGTDITSQKTLEEKYKRAMDDVLEQKQVAEQASKAKSDFVASMSHELRTPLNAILGFAQLIESDTKTPLSEKHKEEMGYIVDSGKYLLSLVNNILDLAKIEAGKSVVSLEPLRLDDAVTEALTLVQNLAEQKHVMIDVVEADSDLLIVADHIKLKQVFTNLLSNAIKYNHQSGNVIVSYKVYDDTSVRVTITDTGIGIAKDNHHRIFSAFDRLDQELSNIEGTGVGLVVTKNLVELMNGSIGFDKELEQGSSFWVDLPLVTSEYIDGRAI